MSPPIISVVMPIYGVERYLSRCIESVLGQTIRDIEIIAVDDGSKDASGQILDAYAAKDRRIRAIHKRNGGYGSAINTGIRLAQGRYVSIVETDDYVPETMLEDLWGLAKDSQVDIARGSYECVCDDRTVAYVQAFGATDNAEFSLASRPDFLIDPPAIWSAIYRRDFLLLNSLQVIETPGASYQDVDFFVRSAILAKSIKTTPKVVYYYRIDNTDSSSNSKGNPQAIFLNFLETDRFVDSLPNLPVDVFAQYDKRKVCDIRWNFNRIAPEFRAEFADLASAEFSKIELLRVLKLLTVRQLRFFLLVRWFPKTSMALLDMLRSFRRRAQRGIPG